MATSKTLTPTNVTIQIPEFTDQPDQRVNSNCIDKEADAINAINSKIGNIKSINISLNSGGVRVRLLSNEDYGFQIHVGKLDANRNYAQFWTGHGNDPFIDRGYLIFDTSRNVEDVT